MYVVTPNPMLEWMQLYINDQLKHPECVVLVPSHELNPENEYYYQSFDDWNQPINKGIDGDHRKLTNRKCQKKNKKQIDEILNNFKPTCAKA